MKNTAKLILQKTLGYKNYLFIFSLFKIYTLKFKKNEQDLLFFINMLPKNGVVLDIGANIGITSIPIAKHITEGKVFSFEPMPFNAKVLHKVINYFNLKNTEVFEIALSNISGSIKMVAPKENGVKMQGLSHIYEENNNSEWNKGEIFTVPVYALDEVQVLKQMPKITAIKIDVENHEYNVLKGGEQLLKKHRPIIYCELWQDEKRKQCISFLESLNYSAKVYFNKTLIDYKDKPDELNLFFTPNLPEG